MEVEASAAEAPVPVAEEQPDQEMAEAPIAEEAPEQAGSPTEEDTSQEEKEAEPASEAEELLKEEEKKAKQTPKAKTPKAKTPKSAPAAPAEGAEGEGRARRERKTVQHFQVAAPKEEEPVLMEGKGEKLRDIPNVAFKMSKITGKDELMESLHNVLYRRKGVATTRKKAILDFSGFAFVEDAEEKEIEARKASMSKWKLELIHRLMDALDLPRGAGDKSSKIDRIMEFLAKPNKLSDVDLAAKEAAKKEKEKKKRERAAAKKEKESAKKRKSPAEKGTGSKKKAKVEESGSDGSSDEESDDEAMATESEEEQPKAKAKSTPAKKKTPAVKKTPTKKATPATKKTPGSKAKAEEGPLAKLSADQIKSDLESVLSKLNPSEYRQLTVKIMLAKMQEFYGFDVRPRKADFKAAMNEYADANPPPEESPEKQPKAQAEAEDAEAAAEEEEGDSETTSE